MKMPLIPNLVGPQALRDFQAEDVEYIRRNGYKCLVASAPGTGKTIVTLAVLNTNPGKLAPALIVCPASVTLNWKREAKKWCPWAQSYVISGETLPLPRKRYDIYVTSWALLAGRVGDLRAKGVQLVVADEFHYAKSAEAQRSQALAFLTESAPYLIGLTGTPIVNNERELDVLRGYFRVEDPDKVPMIRRLLEDVAPDIPPKTRSTVPVVLPPRVRADYGKAEEDFADWLTTKLAEHMDAGEAEEVAEQAISAEALVKIGYLRRILAAGKVSAAIDWVARAVRLGEPVVVFAEHQDVIQRLERSLHKRRISFVTVDGSTSSKERQRAVDMFQAGRVSCFIGSKAAKEGITLTRARNLLFVERWFTAAEEEQGEDRIRRIGQKFPTRIWFLHADGTVDDRLAEIIEHKRHVVRNAIGSSDIAESDEKTVVALLRTWSKKAGVVVRSDRPLLGHGAVPLPSLPSPRDTCSILFAFPRWATPDAAVQWARMNGYHVTKVEAGNSLWRVWNHPPARFVPGSFRTIPLSDDIRVVVGTRTTG